MFCKILKMIDSKRKLFACDTFSGFPYDDIIGREDKYKKIELDNTFPSFILNNVSEFKDWIV